jgi:hypothetical protein
MLPVRVSPFAFPSFRPRVRRRRGFTITEIVVVVGLIVAFVGIFGLALRDGAGSSLVRAQNSLAALVGQARAQAAVNQTDARLVVYAVRPPGGDPEKFLRLCQVFVANTPGATPTWLPVGNPVYLPQGVFIVPSATAGLLAQGVTWPANPAPVSSFTNTSAFTGQPTGSPFANATAVYFLQFAADGTMTPAVTPYFKIAVTTGGLSTTNLPSFNNQFAVRGLIIRPSGAVSYVNETSGF